MTSSHQIASPFSRGRRVVSQRARVWIDGILHDKSTISILAQLFDFFALLRVVIDSQEQKKIGKDRRLFSQQNHHFEQTLSIFDFMKASISQNDRANSELSQINTPHVI
jgi:hypothetical protein